jgi:hypothetical protein
MNIACWCNISKSVILCPAIYLSTPVPSGEFHILEPRSLLPVDVTSHSTHSNSGLRLVPDAMIKKWNSFIKFFSKGDDSEEPNSLHAASDDFDIDADFNVDAHGVEIPSWPNGLVPTLSNLESSLNVEETRALLGDHPSASLLTNVVKQALPLNKKQTMILEQVLSVALASKDDPYNAINY